MNNKWKRTLGIVMATASLGAAIALSGCNGAYTGDKLDGYVSEASVVSNGGFAVQKGDFVYFINGMEDYTEPNVYGDVVKGSLMRIKKADLDAGNYENVKTVVPMLFAAQNFDAGIYIYGDYVYYATPTTDKNMNGEIESSWIDFKRAKLDGTEAMKDYYFRLESNSANYRFVKEGDVVYCLYEEDGYLKSYDTKEKVSRVLAKAESYFYDTSNPTNPTVYYTIPEDVDADSDNSTTAAYNQLYSVNAAARVERVDKNAASYTVKGGNTYDFDESYLNEQNEKAKKDGKEAIYDLADYTTYPYVNLGKAVLDGIGSNAKQTQFNGNKADALTPDGYTYTIKDYANGGVYFTRTEVAKTSSDAESTKLYYLADAVTAAATWNVVSGNGSNELDVVAPDATLLDSAIKTVKNGAHEYYTLSEGALYKTTVGENGASTEIKMSSSLSGATLWKLDGDFLYYYQSPENGNGNSISRINVTGEQKDYNTLLDKVEYQPITLAGVQFNSSWYKPEIFGNKVLFANEQSFGSVTYNYIYAADLPATQAEIKAINEKYEAVQEAINEYEDNTDLQAVMTYYFRTGKTDAYDGVDGVKSLYDEKTEQKYFNEFKDKFSATTDKLELESYFFDLVGEMKATDKTAIDEAWVKSLRSEEETEEKSGLPGWAIALIVAGSVIVVLAAALIPTLIVLSKKKAKAKVAEETVNAYRRKKIDTTDDKSIDVYADENAETPTEAASEEASAESKCCHCKACAAAEEESVEEKSAEEKDE